MMACIKTKNARRDKDDDVFENIDKIRFKNPLSEKHRTGLSKPPT